MGQYFILASVRHKIRQVKSAVALPATLHRTVAISNYILGALLIAIVLEMLIDSTYKTILFLSVLVLSYGLSFFALGALALRLFAWFKARGSLTILLYGLSSSLFVISNALIMIFVLFVTPQIGDVIQPHGHLIMYFSDPGSIQYLLYNGYVICSILTFIFFWASTALLMKHYSKRLGNLKYWILVGIPLLYFLSQFITVYLSLFNSLMIQSPLVYGVLLSVVFSVSKSVGGILFAIGFWVMAKKTNQITTLTDFLKLAAIGVMLLYASERAVSLTSAPYPPFGLTCVATVGLASYLIMIALQYSAISVSSEMRTRKIILRSALQEFSLLGNIGFAENENEIEKVVDNIVKKHSSVIETNVETSPTPEDIRKYTTEVLDEVRRLKKL